MNALSLKELESELEKISKNEYAAMNAHYHHQSSAESARMKAGSFTSQAKEFRAKAKVYDHRALIKAKEWDKLNGKRHELENKIREVEL
tara:strand:- start:269 stop:535 length:267 start_codon:yes stop_codon:yes gene_type:complete